MIIKIEGADYSNCGLGTVELPIIVSDEVKAIMENYTNYNNESNQKTLQKFYNSINSFKDKIKVLCLPMFATTSDEAVLNVIDGTRFTQQPPEDMIVISSDRTTGISSSYQSSDFTKISTDYNLKIPTRGSSIFIGYKNAFIISLFNSIVSEVGSAVAETSNSTESEVIGFCVDNDLNVSTIGDLNVIENKKKWSSLKDSDDHLVENYVQQRPFGRNSNNKGSSVVVVCSGLTDEEVIIMHKSLTILNKEFV